VSLLSPLAMSEPGNWIILRLGGDQRMLRRRLPLIAKAGSERLYWLRAVAVQTLKRASFGANRCWKDTDDQSIPDEARWESIRDGLRRWHCLAAYNSSSPTEASTHAR